MAAEKRGKYGIKQYDIDLYTWSPFPDDPKRQPDPRRIPPERHFCSATDGSQGEDWFTTYDYDLSVVTGIIQRIAYVTCDYVQ